jgi:hypothetical protein
MLCIFENFKEAEIDIKSSKIELVRGFRKFKQIEITILNSQKKYLKKPHNS